jgi:hypothetical protein
MITDQRFRLQGILLKVDAMNIVHSLEVGVPLLDRCIMEIAGHVDVSCLHPRCDRPKHLLSAAAERLGAPASVTQARKHGFNAPNSQLFAHDAQPLWRAGPRSGCRCALPQSRRSVRTVACASRPARESRSRIVADSNARDAVPGISRPEKMADAVVSSSGGTTRLAVMSRAVDMGCRGLAILLLR